MGVTYLLDTHVLLWLLGTPEKVPEPLRAELATGSTRLLVSAASAMEIATKVRLGRLDAAHPLLATWDDRLTALGADPLEISPAHALLAGSMPWQHRDPFDRFLAAQSIVENVPLVTADAALHALPGLHVRWA